MDWPEPTREELTTVRAQGPNNKEGKGTNPNEDLYPANAARACIPRDRGPRGGDCGPALPTGFVSRAIARPVFIYRATAAPEGVTVGQPCHGGWCQRVAQGDARRALNETLNESLEESLKESLTESLQRDASGLLQEPPGALVNVPHYGGRCTSTPADVWPRAE